MKKIGLNLALALAGLVWLSPHAAAQGFLGAVMSLQQGDAVCDQPPSTTAFLTTDPAAWAWAAVSSAGQGDAARIQFFDPSGNLNTQFDYPNLSPGHTCFTSASVPINSDVFTGTWTMKFYYRSNIPSTNLPPFVLLATVSFTISTPPPLSITTTSLPNGTAGTSYSTNVAATGGSPPYTFSATGLPSALNISPAGAITGIPGSTGVSTVTVTVIDSARMQVSKPLSLTISQAFGALTITTTSLPDGVVGQNYSQTVNASGGRPPYMFYATGLPSPLQMSTSGTITGIPPSTGTSMVTVTVYDQTDGGHAIKQFSLTIDPAIPPLSITTTSLSAGGTGQMYSQSVAATGGTPPYTFSASGLPPGLNISPGGNISGTPTANGSYPVAVTVMDAANGQASRSYTLNITSSLTITTPSLVNGSVGHSYFQTLNAVGGTIPYTFTATGLPTPDLTVTPTGTTLVAQISGTPSVSSAGTYTVDVTVTDAKKVSATAEYTLILYTLPTFSTSSPLPDATAGVNYTQTFAATGGLAPYKFFLISGPAGVNVSTAGVLTATFASGGSVTLSAQVIDANNNASTKAFTLNVNGPLQQLNVTPLSIQFTAPFGGGELPHAQNIIVTGGPPGTVYQLKVDDGNGGAAPTALKVTPLSGAVPGVIHASLVPNTLPGGTYPARIHITATSGTNNLSPVDVAVTITLAAGMPSLSVNPTSMRFSRRNPEEALIVHNGGSGGPLNFTATVAGSSSFITSVTPSSGQTPAVLHVKVNAGAPGASRDSIHIASSAGNADVPVSLFVPAPGPALAIAQTGFRFQTTQGAGTSTTETIRILNEGDAGTTLNWIAELVAGGDWLSLGSTSGAATSTSPGTLILKTGPGAAALAQGGHYALIRISASGAQNSPQYLAGVLDVGAAGAPAAPDPTKGGFFFEGAASGAQPLSQLLEVGVSSAAPVKVVAAASTTDGAKWLSVTATNDSASSAQTAEFSISANTTGLTKGIYTGEIDLAILNQVRAVNVTLDVAPAGTTFSTSSFSESKTRDASGCVPSQLAVTETGIVNNFSIPASWPATLEMQLNDDCGSPVINGTVVASFSNGDVPITLLGDGQTPFYSATWQPGNASSPMAITMDAAAPGLASASAQLSGGVNANPTPAPSLVIDGLLHNVNPVVGAPLAPGTVSQVYGTNLATSPDAPTAVPLPINFKGVQVLVGGLNAPLYYISPTQLTIQIPSELTATNQYQALISVNGAFTLPQPVDLVPVAPGVVAFADGSLVAQHSSDFTLVDANRPAKPGEVLIIYLVGLGGTSVNVQSGTPAPLSQLVVANTPAVVTIDGQTAQTPFVGLTPGGIGLYQINLIVPSNARAGKLPVTITQGGIAANATTLLVQP
jgi:uncharacterized protein (TIGR03437 family)